MLKRHKLFQKSDLNCVTMQYSTHLMDLDPIAFEIVIPGCVPVNVINSINQLNLEGEMEKKHNSKNY